MTPEIMGWLKDASQLGLIPALFFACYKLWNAREAERKEYDQKIERVILALERFNEHSESK